MCDTCSSQFETDQAAAIERHTVVHKVLLDRFTADMAKIGDTFADEMSAARNRYNAAVAAHGGKDDAP